MSFFEILKVSKNLESALSDESVERANQKLQQFLIRKDIGFSELPFRTKLIDQTWNLAQEMRIHYNEMVIVGVGGSSLGVRALAEMTDRPGQSHCLHFCDNTDPLEFEKLWTRIKDIKKTCWVFISKSGSTIETLVAADFIQSRLGTEMKAIVISQPEDNPLTLWAKKFQFQTLEIPFDVGGRFSVLSPVGLLPAAFLGISIQELMKGAEEALKDSTQVSKMISLVLESFHQKCWITFFFFYNSNYLQMGRWLQQLWAESLAKKVNRNGLPAPRASTPMWGIGACDQHSLLQQLMEGEKDKLIIVQKFAALESDRRKLSRSHFDYQQFFVGHTMGELIAAQSLGTSEALEVEGAKVLTIKVNDFTTEFLGYQFMFWQLVVAGLGESLDIDAFNQPGVELGKRLAQKNLKASSC